MYPGLVVVVWIVVLVVRVEWGAGDQAGQGEQQQQHGYMGEACYSYSDGRGEDLKLETVFTFYTVSWLPNL